ncbi:MOSC domain-containing protein [Kribbella sp.]|uniref:MOSC domain-containing protein n=1 Tax=Kribbella sp. TaxID=1871183 RepID=UPI002D239410|nr:MOSC domain-containing protein [Kribbella sp.]HZX01831.1 MOSC domain-containing protein [Kribbella sp.]
MQVEIVAFVVSGQHAFEGRPQDGPRPDPAPVARTEIEVRAGLGIVGDRYYGQAVHQNAAVTFIDAASLDEVVRVLDLPTPLDPHLTRRNITLRGFPIDDLAAGRAADGSRVPGRRFTLGGITFQANRPANPCAWMDQVLAPGAMRALRGHGGIRATPLTSGTLRLGPTDLTVLD